jgi:hypothetical protein
MGSLSWAYHFFEIRDSLGDRAAMESTAANEKLRTTSPQGLISDLIVVS